MIPKSLLFLMDVAASDNDVWARDTEVTRDKKEGGCLSGGGEDKVGKVTIHLLVLRKETMASMALSLTFCALGQASSSVWASVLFSVKQGPFQLEAQPGRLKDRQECRGCIESCF